MADSGTDVCRGSLAPHVGVRLAPDEDATCLQTWNATFVFDENSEDPRLIGVVYDQWEW